MSSIGDNILEEGVEWMIPISEVTQVRWDERKAKILNDLMIKTKGPKGKSVNPHWLSKQLKRLGYKISYQHIYRLKGAHHDSVSIDFVLKVCDIFGKSPSVFISGFYVGK